MNIFSKSTTSAVFLATKDHAYERGGWLIFSMKYIFYQGGVAHNASIYVEKIAFVLAALMTHPSAAQVQGSTTIVLRG